jgi:hypothetical protein
VRWIGLGQHAKCSQRVYVFRTSPITDITSLSDARLSKLTPQHHAASAVGCHETHGGGATCAVRDHPDPTQRDGVTPVT